MPLEDDHSERPAYPSTDDELGIAETSYYTRLAAKACFHIPDVVAVDGVPEMGELWVYVNADHPGEVLEEVLWLFNVDIEHPHFQNTEEFGPVMSVELNIESEDVIGFDVSNTDKHESPYRVEDYIEDYIIAEEEEAAEDAEDPILYNHLPEEPVDGLATTCLAERTTRNFLDYHPTMDGELEREAAAWREPDGSWKARYKLRTATAATCYGALRKALDYHHRDEFGTSMEEFAIPNEEDIDSQSEEDDG